MLRAVKSGLSAMRRNPVVQAVAVGTVAMSMLLVGLVRLAALNVDRMAESWGKDVEVIVYLEDGVDKTSNTGGFWQIATFTSTAPLLGFDLTLYRSSPARKPPQSPLAPLGAQVLRTAANSCDSGV